MARLNLYAADGWKPPLQDPNSFQVEVHREALMLTVQPEYESQVDNLSRVGGKGLYKAAYDLDMEWTIIRGVVSALADESEEENVEELWKRFASVMAVSVVHNMFKYPVVLQDWPQRG